jgi:cellulose synthase/poly-beta-1,6-N-acetylglucosamine synthase-like glycosyltransferase
LYHLLQAEYLAVGEAPEELRNVLRQRSRWTKGHMQVGLSGVMGRLSHARQCSRSCSAA